MGKEKEEETPKKKENQEVKLVSVVSETQLTIQTEDGTQLTPIELQVMIYNKLCKIEKAVA